MTEKTFHRAKKYFGQNFLVDETIVAQIISVIAPHSDQHLVEIGPGLGALTKHLLPKVKAMDVIEIDRDIIPKLEQQCHGLGRLIIHQADVLKFDFATLVRGNENLKIIGNLPYNISTPLLFHLVSFCSLVSEMIFMLQKEVVERICAPLGSKAYGRLTVMLQYHYQAQHLLDVPPQAFKPAPQVHSAILRLVPHKNKPFLAKDVKLFAQIVLVAFNARRKTLRNALKNLVNDEIFLTLDIDSQLRPEQISLGQYVAISNQLVGEKTCSN